MHYEELTFPLDHPKPFGLEVYHDRFQWLPFRNSIKVARNRLQAKINADSGPYALFRSTNLVFVRIPKNASTSLCTFLYGGENKSRWPEHHSAEYYRRVVPDLYRSLVSFASVRHPYKRAKSAFNYLKHKTADIDDRRLMDGELSYLRTFEDFLEYVAGQSELQTLPILSSAVFRRQTEFISDPSGKVIVDLLFPVEDMSKGIAALKELSNVKLPNDIETTNTTSSDGSSGDLPSNLRSFYRQDYELWERVTEAGLISTTQKVLFGK